MKINTAVTRIFKAIDEKQFVNANNMLTKYSQKFGNRKFTYWMRLYIKNGLWEQGIE
jgi:hypothetical protein